MSRAPQAYDTRGASGRGVHSGYERLAKGLGVFSIGLGLVEMLAPRALCKAIGLEGHETLVRAYGIRETMAGVAILMSHDPTPWMIGRVAGDAVDLATLAVDQPEDASQRANRAIAAVAVAGVTMLDIACAYGLSADKRLSKSGDYDYADRSGFLRSPQAMRGAASDFDVPGDYRVPDPLRPWQDGRPAPGTSASVSASTP